MHSVLADVSRLVNSVSMADSTAFFLAENGNPGEVVEFDSTENVFIRPKDERTNEYVNGRFG